MIKNDRRVNSLTFYRIIATLMITILHFLNKADFKVSGWAIFVDFFFVVSGLLLAMTLEKKGFTTKQYMIRRYKRIWPHFIWGYLVYFAMLLIKCWPDLVMWGGLDYTFGS